MTLNPTHRTCRVLLDVSAARRGECAISLAVVAGRAEMSSSHAWRLADDLRAAADVAEQIHVAELESGHDNQEQF